MKRKSLGLLAVAKERARKNRIESTSDFKDRIASICLGIPVEQVVLNRGARIHAAQAKWVEKHFGTSHVRKMSCRSCGKELGTTAHCDECKTYGGAQ